MSLLTTFCLLIDPVVKILPNIPLFLLVYGREARLPIDLTRPVSESKCGCDDIDTKVDRMLEIRAKLHSNALANIERGQERQKHHYDAKTQHKYKTKGR